MTLENIAGGDKKSSDKVASKVVSILAERVFQVPRSQITWGGDALPLQGLPPNSSTWAGTFTVRGPTRNNKRPYENCAAVDKMELLSTPEVKQEVEAATGDGGYVVREIGCSEHHLLSPSPSPSPSPRPQPPPEPPKQTGAGGSGLRAAGRVALKTVGVAVLTTAATSFVGTACGSLF